MQGLYNLGPKLYKSYMTTVIIPVEDFCVPIVIIIS